MIGSEARLQRRRASRAIAVEVALAGAASITIVNRDPRRGLELVALLNEKTPARADLVGWDRAYRIPHHLEKLKNENLVKVRREGTFLWYSANPEALQELLGFLYAECCTRNKAIEPWKIVSISK